MKRYFPTTPKIPKSSSTSQDLFNLEERASELEQDQQSERANLRSLEVDPGERLAIQKYHPNDHDAIRRKYIQKGLFQPREHKFPQRNFYGKLRRFNPQWFDEYDWLEYSITKDAAFCLYCYLFQDDCINQGEGDVFSTIRFTIDESRDVSCKEKMVIVLWYVDRRGSVMVRFIGIVHVCETTALSLKNEIVGLLSQYSLSPSSIHGQYYNGAISRKCDDVQEPLLVVSDILNMVGSSFKHRDKLRESQADEIEEALRKGELETGRGLNQELGLARAGDTRWGSHYKSFNNFILMFGPITDVLDAIVVNARFEEKCKAKGCLKLENYIVDVRDHDKRFSDLKGLGDLSKKLVETKKHGTYPLVFRLVKFALILPVAIATVERAFSTMKLIKTDLRNRMDDELLSGCLVPYIEKDVFCNVSNEAIMNTFQNMKTRRGEL
ncbi:uncharacterized protein LOC107768311 [Nicotiana tabacum]|uniref:Uncharacterized protein LOC107768311 n=1 Tax=Nicotiana tabacum TaxID=4097 RepID=A0AC58TV94_TOBAC